MRIVLTILLVAISQTGFAKVEKDELDYYQIDKDANLTTLPYKQTVDCKTNSPKAQAEMAHERSKCLKAVIEKFKVDNASDFIEIVTYSKHYNVEWVDADAIELNGEPLSNYCDIHTISVDGSITCAKKGSKTVNKDYHCVVINGNPQVTSAGRVCGK